MKLLKTEHAADKGKIHACEAVTEQEGWTAERLMGYLDTKAKDGSFKEQMQAIAFDINASIAAEQSKWEFRAMQASVKFQQLREQLQIAQNHIESLDKANQQLCEELAAEREKVRALLGSETYGLPDGRTQ